MIAFSYQGCASATRPIAASVRPSRTSASTSSGSRFVHAFIIGDQPGAVVVAEEDLLDLAADLLVQPAIGAELAQHRLEVLERLLRPIEPHLELGRLHGELDLAERIADLPGQGLEPRQGLRRLVLLGQRRGDLLLHAGVVGEQRLQPRPDRQRLVGFLRALVDPPQGLEDLQQVVPRRLALERALEGVGGLLGLADQDQGLAEVIRGQGIVGPGGLGLAERGDGGGVLAALELQQAEDQRGGAVLARPWRGGRGTT